MYVKSPLNYTGGKFKLLNQIIPLFPKKIDIFCDIFAGGCNIGINIKANKIICNDINKEIIELFNYFKITNIEEILSELESTIYENNLSNSSKYGYEFYGCNSTDGLSKYNKEFYTSLKNKYNLMPSPILFFTLVIYAFNNQIRFNNKGQYNLPAGKRDFNTNIKTNLVSFVERIKNLNIEFINSNYKTINLNSNYFVYFDPPYLASTASYNENNGWNIQKEIELLEYIDMVDGSGIKFALSNVFINKNKNNDILIEWSKKYNVNYLNHSYSNSSYQSKHRSVKTVEVLITNY